MSRPRGPSAPGRRAGSGGRPARRGVRLAVLGLSLALGLGVAEGALRAVSARGLHLFDVEMWRYARLVKAPSARPGVIEEHRTDAAARLMGVTVRTDGHGFRRPDPATEAARRPGERRVVALGDSVTFGWGVPEAETWPATFERLLRARCPGAAATVVNAGVGNSNTPMQVARYERILRPLGVDWLILGYFVNDAEPDPRPSRNPLIWRSALAATVEARLRQGTQPALRDYRRFYGRLYADGQPGWEAAREAIGRLGRRLAADGVAATVLLLPEMHEPRHFGPFAGAYRRVAEAARDAGFEVVDASAAFPPGSGERWFVSPTDAHPDGAAQRLFAEALLGSRHACP